MSSIKEDILKFQDLTGLSDYRVGWLLASNGMLVSRLKNNGRNFPETLRRAEERLGEEVDKRGLDRSKFHCLRPDDIEAPQ
ncbi:hypothetical protein [Pacificoceanicola onchidii]|uniref:hypothetical protein n=1 Tax=Pacificoceanicola onchidii TaxID=2562685 RepID=UPI0010A3102F|nr:hypothetical protein [Pacificoceanicola onchidii]